MKKIVALILLTAFATTVFSQNDCTRPLSTQQFQQRYQQIKNRAPESSQLQLANQFVKSYCFSSNQIKEIALLFDDDNIRLQFAKTAYQNTTDKNNYYEVFDAFIYYSSVFRLHDFISNTTSESDPTSNDNENTQIEFPDYNYPEFKNYRGQENCDRYISDRQFNYIVTQINATEDENAKLSKAKTLIQNNCIPTAYLMKIGSLFPSDAKRYEFAKASVNSVYDIDQYIEMQQIFFTPRNRSSFADFLSGVQTTSTGQASTNECFITDNEYNQIIGSLKKESFNSTKLKSAKYIIETKKCLSPLQIKGIVELFDYENSRLEMAMLGYDFTKNKDDYYNIVSEALGFENSKRKLLDHINKR
ncbi:MAG: DUF4476 domain-containing protein [Bacteroidales bacterium]